MAKSSGPGGDRHQQACIASIVMIRVLLGVYFLYLGVSAIASLPNANSFIDQLFRETAVDGKMVIGNSFKILRDFLVHYVHLHATGTAWVLIVTWIITGIMLILGLLTRFAAGISIIVCTSFLLSRLYLANDVINADSLGLYGGLIIMSLATLISAAGRTMGIDKAIAARTRVKILW
ncbi:MAG: TQO small subunit DoxD [bacterium]